MDSCIIFVIHCDIQVVQCRAIATGNWGCGAFGGDPQLKSLIQWIAASVCGVPLLKYYTFGDDRMSQVRALSVCVRNCTIIDLCV